MFFRTLLTNRMLRVRLESYCLRAILCIGIFFTFSIISVIVQAEQTKTTFSVEELRKIAPLIEAAEKGLHNIKIESESWIERGMSLDDPNEPWERTPIYYSSTAWYDSIPWSKARIDVHKEVLEWTEGSAPYCEMSYSLSFDGQYGRQVNKTMKYNDRTFFVKDGKNLSLTQIRMRDREIASGTGILFSLNYSINKRGFAFSEIVRKSTEDPNFATTNKLTFNWGKSDNGADCIRIVSGTKKKGHRFKSYLLDPARNFALLESKSLYVHEDGSEQIINSIKVNKLKKVAETIWWPVEAYIERSSTSLVSKKPYERIVYRATNIVLNDPNFTDTVFTVPFPEGYIVYDEEKGTKYRVGQEQKIKEK